MLLAVSFSSLSMLGGHQLKVHGCPAIMHEHAKVAVVHMGGIVKVEDVGGRCAR